MIEDRTAQIRSLKGEYFEQTVASHEEETLHLEFKTLSRDGSQLTRDDRKTIGEAVSGMANAEGGVLILGIETETSNGIDVAAAKRPIKNLQRTTNLVRSCISDALSPPHPGIEVFCVSEQGKQDEGFIVIDVPHSSNRPHYSNSNHRYFRRGSNGTRVLEHSEIRELMFAVREGNIEVRVSGQTQSLSGDRISGLILLSIHNIGPVPVTAPYLKVSPDDGWVRAPEAPNSEVRQSPPNTVGIYTTHAILHIDDRFPMAARSCAVHLRENRFGLRLPPPTILKMIRESKDQDSFDVDRLFGPFEMTFGAMNAPPKTVKFDLDKWDMFEMIAKAVLKEG
jgi:hypothetical protein